MNVKDTARTLRTALQEIADQTISHSQALEICARLHGYRNWHECRQRELGTEETTARPVTATSDLGPFEFSDEEKALLKELAYRDPSPVYDFEAHPPHQVVTHHVEVSGVGIAHGAGGAGVWVTKLAQDTTCFSCGVTISAGELCTRSADRKGTVAGIRYTRCRRCVPIVITPRDPEAIRLDHHMALLTRLTFRTRENALVFFRVVAGMMPVGHLYSTHEIDGDQLAEHFGIRLPDSPQLDQ